jgi:hypothetical protein
LPLLLAKRKVSSVIGRLSGMKRFTSVGVQQPC